MFERKIMIKNHWIENKTKSNLYENRCFGIKECAEKWKNSKYRSEERRVGKSRRVF